MKTGLRKRKLLRLICFPIILIKRALLRYRNRNIRFYRALISNVKEGRLVVTINGINGLFEMDIRSHILERILISKKYEANIAAVLNEVVDEQRDAINIGANIGIFAIHMTSLISAKNRVLAVEPTPLAFSMLRSNIERNNKNDKVLLFNGICADKRGEYLINTIFGKEEYSSLGDSTYMSNIPEAVVQIKVIGETLDNLVDNYNLDPGLVLIDVEGAEMKVLIGATKLLKTNRPIIISEINDDLLIKQATSSREVVSFLEKIGYEIKNISNNNGIRYPFHGDILARPKM